MTTWKFLELWYSLTLRWRYFKVHCYFTYYKEKKYCQLSYHTIFLITYILTFYLSILLILGYFFQASDANFEADTFYNLAVELMRVLYNK